MQFNHITKDHTIQSLISAVVVLPLVLGVFFALEPSVVKGQGLTREFTVSQVIDGEISFVGVVDSVGLSPNIPGITGGTGNGTTTFSVNTNNPDGYTVSIEFDNPTAAMQFTGGAGSIPNFGSTVEELFDVTTVAANSAAFGFTVDGPRIDTLFRDLTGTCNSGSGISTSDTCWWLGDTTGGTVIVDGAGTADEEVHTLHFRVHVNENPSPQLELGTYTATATLTLATKT